MLMGTLAGIEMGLELAGVPHRKGGVDAAMTTLTSAAAPQQQTDVSQPDIQRKYA